MRTDWRYGDERDTVKWPIEINGWTITHDGRKWCALHPRARDLDSTFPSYLDATQWAADHPAPED